MDITDFQDVLDNDVISDSELLEWVKLFEWADELGISENILPRDIAKCLRLIKLNLRNQDCCNYEEFYIPEQIKLLKNLTYFDFCDNSCYFDDEMRCKSLNNLAKLKNLEHLNLSGIVNIDDNTWRDDGYVLLGFSCVPEQDSFIYNVIDAVDNVIKSNPKLEYLNLSNNTLHELPRSVYFLKHLKHLIINDNGISEHEAEVVYSEGLEDEWYDGYSPCSTLKIDEKISYLINLETLEISDCQLFEFPESILHLSNLRKLDISHNQLSHAVTTEEDGYRIYNYSLEELDLSFNELVERPDITNFKKLAKFDFTFNLFNRDQSELLIKNNVFIKVGDIVQHAKFGKGKIINCSYKRNTPIAEIFFIGLGKKHLDLNIADIEKITNSNEFEYDFGGVIYSKADEDSCYYENSDVVNESEALEMEYKEIIVESYFESGSGLHGIVHIRPAKNQYHPQHLRVECSKDLIRLYPVGTQFKLKVKLTDRKGGQPFLYCHYKAQYEVVT